MSNSDTAIKIRGEFTPDPNVCRFVVNKQIVPEEVSVLIRNAEEAKGSPLAEAIFEDEGVGQLKVQSDILLITKSSDEPWPKLAARLIPLMKAVLNEEQDYISASCIEDAKVGPAPEKLKEMIEELFETNINPAIASHGGWVKLVKIEDADVYLEMGGGCQGCASSAATLSFGIEKSIRDMAPSVRKVIDVTDHDAGQNPYYS